MQGRKDSSDGFYAVILYIMYSILFLVFCDLKQGDLATLKKTCSREVVERCQAERRALESQGIFLDNQVQFLTTFFLMFHNVVALLFSFISFFLFPTEEDNQLLIYGKFSLSKFYIIWLAYFKLTFYRNSTPNTLLASLGCKQILHISDVEIKETKLLGNSPIIIITVSTHFQSP